MFFVFSLHLFSLFSHFGALINKTFSSHSALLIFLLLFFSCFLTQPFCSTFWNFFGLFSNTSIECLILTLSFQYFSVVHFYSMLLFYGCNMFYVSETITVWGFYVPFIISRFCFVCLFVCFLLVFIFHCWRYLQTPSDSWLLVYCEFEWLKAVYEGGGLWAPGFTVTNNHNWVVSCFLTHVSGWGEQGWV